MEIPGLGSVIKDDDFDWYYSNPMPIALLDGQMCRIAVEGYFEDPNQEEINTAIANFLAIEPSVLKDAEPSIFQHYKDCNEKLVPDHPDYVVIESPGDVWEHIKPSNEPIIRRRAYGDQGIYVSLECDCDWAKENGLQIVFKNGLTVNKVGTYDGHLSNSDAFDDDSLEDIVYHSPES